MSVSSDNSIGWILGDLGRLLRKLADRRFGAFGLTRAQWQALGNLRRCGPMTQATLADALEVETATIARLIDRLEAAGWVVRRADPHDRRVKRVSLTDKAENIMYEVSNISHQLRDEMLADLSTEERDQLFDALLTVKARLVRLLETQ
jgi:DNA-binding MarR family transcriptional regulator